MFTLLTVTVDQLKSVKEIQDFIVVYPNIDYLKGVVFLLWTQEAENCNVSSKQISQSAQPSVEVFLFLLDKFFSGSFQKSSTFYSYDKIKKCNTNQLVFTILLNNIGVSKTLSNST